VKAAQLDTGLRDYFNEPDFNQFSRIPIYKDTIEDCTAYVLKIDVLENLIRKSNKKRLADIKRKIIIIPESLAIDKLFERFMLEKEHIAMVVDEYGGFEGIVTLEDIIETLLGLEIQDETDAHPDMQVLAREKWKIKAKKMNWELPEEDN